jgi:hypothetical protein
MKSLFQKTLLIVMGIAWIGCGGSSSPSIDSISPDEGTELGGTLVTLEGDNFVEIIIIFIGGAECESINVISEKKLTCVTGANPAVLTDSIVDIEIRNNNGDNGKLKNAFTYRSE